MIVDEFSKFVILKPVANVPDAIQAAEIMVTDVFPYFDIPSYVHSDKGPAFTSNIWTKGDIVRCQQTLFMVSMTLGISLEIASLLLLNPAPRDQNMKYNPHKEVN